MRFCIEVGNPLFVAFAEYDNVILGKEISERLSPKSSDALTAVLYRHSIIARSLSVWQEERNFSTSSADNGFFTFFWYLIVSRGRPDWKQGHVF